MNNIEKLKEYAHIDSSHIGETLEEMIYFYDDYKELDDEFELNEELIYQIEVEMERWLKYYQEKYIIVEDVVKPSEYTTKKLKAI